MQSYFLSKDSYICESSGHAVFLDLKRNRYLALPPDATACLRTVFPGLNAPNSRSDPTEQAVTSHDLAHMLEREGLLVRNASRGKLPDLTSLAPAKGAFREQNQSWPHLQLSHIINFSAAAAIAALLLKTYSLKAIVNRVRRRKTTTSGSKVLDNSDVLTLTGVYTVLEPILFSYENTCLKRSLTLLEFLASYDINPTWVFGVRVDPFAAHCWVQEGQFVLNDNLHHTSTFTPLMVL